MKRSFSLQQLIVLTMLFFSLNGCKEAFNQTVFVGQVVATSNTINADDGEIKHGKYSLSVKTFDGNEFTCYSAEPISRGDTLWAEYEIIRGKRSK